MRAIDRVEKPITFWYEDEMGNHIPFNWNDGFPQPGWHAQRSKSLVIKDSICFGNRYGKDLWPVRLVKWVLYRMPLSWKRPVLAMSGESTINCGYTVVKYLVEKRNFSFHDACVLYGDVCERCSNILTWNAEGVDLETERQYLDNSRTTCKYCKIIDPDYFNKRRMMACYKTFFAGGRDKEMVKAYDTISVVNVAMHSEHLKQTFFRKLLNKLKKDV